MWAWATSDTRRTTWSGTSSSTWFGASASLQVLAAFNSTKPSRAWLPSSAGSISATPSLRRSSSGVSPRCWRRSTRRPQNLRRYRAALGSLEGETEDVVGAITYLNFNRVHDRFYDLVLRADVGKIDVSWARREDHRVRIDTLTRERARELQALDDEFRDVMDQNQGSEDEP